MELRTVGVEEELLLIDPCGGRPRAVSGAALRYAEDASAAHDGQLNLSHELQQQQLETDTRPCHSLNEVGAELRRWRRAAAHAAERAGAQVAALATSPIAVEPATTPEPRYRRMAEEFGLVAQEQLSCGCHVHVAVNSGEEGVAVLDRIRPWLPLLLALSANSPFWQGGDSGYASYRSQVWSRWPSAGPTGTFGSLEGYQAAIRELLASGTVLDEGMVYFDARLARHQPTVEIRVADVCMHTEDAVLLAALARGLVETAARAWRAGVDPPLVRTELLRVASWRAGRSGTETDLVHPTTGHPVPAAVAVQALLDHVASALADAGELDTVRELLRAVLRRGTGSRAQRAVFARTGRLADVVADAVIRTAGMTQRA
jgi:carboxylate-amine ligase